MPVTLNDTPPASVAARTLSVRPLREGDSAEELTALLHRAYRPQVEMGLRPLAGRQTVEVTRERAASGECFVATLRDALGATDALVGTILFQEIETARFPPFFLRQGVTHFSLFAVDPDHQGRGVGLALLGAVETRARALGANELACSMAEPDTALMAFYLKRGFRFVEHWQWPYTNYRSAILSKGLG
ncbi:MAG TPA: GNAT family N-acetyltransferase [Phycisphaerales bacterium]|nr:GNAT family N-acetyltransferase [Phycisphaerales bacterium]